MKLNTSSGWYQPSFFVVKVDHPFQSSDNGFGCQGNLVVAHELVHFMQDFFTVYGISCVSAMTDRLAFIRSNYETNQAMPSIAIKRPTVRDASQYLNLKLLNAYQGLHKVIHSCRLRDPVIRTVHEGDREVKKLFCTESVDDTQIQIGAWHLLESMADAAERMMGSQRETPSIPYHTDEEILRSFGFISVPPSIRLVLLEHVLQTVENPAPYYYWMVKDASKREVDLSDINSTLKFLASAYVTDMNGARIVPTDRFTKLGAPLVNLEVLIQCGVSGRNKTLIEKAREHLSGQAGNYPVYKAIRRAQDDPWIFCQLVFNEYVGPCIVDSNFGIVDLDVHVATREPMVFPALYTLYSMLHSAEKVRCELVDVCSKNCLNLVDEHCTSAPWKRPRSSHYCWFDSAIIANGMHKVTFVD